MEQTEGETVNPVDKARRMVVVADMLLAGYTNAAILNIVPNYPASRFSVIRKYLGIPLSKRGRKIGSVSAKTAAAQKFLAGPDRIGMTLAEIGREFNVSRQRIHQIENPDKQRCRVARWRARLKSKAKLKHSFKNNKP